MTGNMIMESKMKTLQEALSPIKFPALICANVPCNKQEYNTAIAAIPIARVWRDPSNDDTYIWDDQESRLWFFGRREAFVLYFNFEYGKPFAWLKDSLLITRKANSFDWDKLATHLMMSLQYPIAASNELLPADGPYPAILSELVKKKLLPVKAEKFARHIFDQFCMEKLGFRQPTLSRYDVLSVLVEATSDYSFSQVARTHPMLWSLIGVPGIVNQKHEEKLDKKEDGVQEVQAEFLQVHQAFCERAEGLHGIREVPLGGVIENEKEIKSSQQEAEEGE